MLNVVHHRRAAYLDGTNESLSQRGRAYAQVHTQLIGSQEFLHQKEGLAGLLECCCFNKVHAV